jgi:uncharacterized membrane protein
MTEADILHWIRDTWLGATVRQSRWIFATGEILHFIGLSLLVGGILIVDLRLLGFIRRIPVRAALTFLPFVIAGFLINLLTGIVFFAADPYMYWPNPAFKLKMVLILLAGLNALVFTIMEHRHALTLDPDETAGTFTKVTAGISLSFWLAVLLLGRLLPAFEGSTHFF